MTPIHALAAALIALGAAVVDDEPEYVAIHAGRLLVGNGEEMEGVTILVEDGKVAAIGANVELPWPCRVIDASSATVMPGLIHPHSRLGMLGFGRSGMQAHRRVADEFLPPEDAYDDARAAGFTTIALTAPGRGGIPGRAMVIRTADVGSGWVLEEESYLKMILPRPGGDKEIIAKALKSARDHQEKVKKAREEWEKKKAEWEKKKQAEEQARGKEQEQKESEKGKEGGGGTAAEEEKKEEKKEETFPDFKPPEAPPPVRMMLDLVENKPGVFALVELGGASTWLHFQEAIEGYEFPFTVMATISSGGRSGGSDIFHVADAIGEQERVVLTQPVISTYPYTINQINIPRDLAAAGARVAWTPTSDSKAGLEALRFQVSELIEGGMSRDDALRGLGLHAAQAIGLGERLGSIEKGKDANLLILSGDPFDVQTRVEKVVLEGVVVHEGDVADGS